MKATLTFGKSTGWMRILTFYSGLVNGLMPLMLESGAWLSEHSRRESPCLAALNSCSLCPVINL